MRTRLSVAISAVVAVIVSVALAAAASAAGTPAVTTGSASSVTSSSASVGGTVNPNGTATDYAFQYGTSTSYGEQVSSQSAGSGTSSQTVTATLNGLPSGTTIHFRIIATYGSGSTVVGNDATFTTSGPPPTVPAPTATTSAATSVSAHGAQLGGSVGPTPAGASYYFQYGTNTNYGVETSPSALSASGASQSVKATLADLQSGVTYHFRLVTRSSSGLTATGSDQTFATTVSATPSVTTGSASSITSSSARVAGTVNPQGTPTSYTFQYGTSTSYSAQVSSQSAGSGTSAQAVGATLTGLPSGTTIHYRIVASYGSSTIVVGADATFKTLGAAPTVPAPSATTGAAANVGPNGAQLTGTVGPSSGAASYYFQYGLSSAYGVQTSPGTLGASASSRPVATTLGGLQVGLTYHYRLVTRSATGLTATGADRTFATAAPKPAPKPARARPRALTLHAYTGIGRTRVILGDSGQLWLPAGVAPGSGCRGAVSVRVMAGAVTISTRSFGLSRGCRFHERIVIAKRQLRGHRHVRVSARFSGNAVLVPITARSAWVRA